MSALASWARDAQPALLTLLEELAVIAAPSGEEQDRAVFCRDWMRRHVNDSAYIDDALNAVVEIGDTEQNPIVLLMAHTDIVFDRQTPLFVKKENHRWYCPGIGDDTANLAVLLFCASYLQSHPKERGVSFVIAANAGEEGQGNLKGCKALMERYGDRVREMITFDGYLDTLNDNAVGSKRFLIAVDVTGGHSFRDFGNENAIAVAGELITALSAIPLPSEHITTFNFGHIEGGTTVNSIAAHCELMYEFRADHADNLRYMSERFEQVIDRFRSRAEVTVTDIGQRPCAEGVDRAAWDALIARAEAAFAPLPPLKRYPASTDCNIPLSMGIPSICVGFLHGGGAHTVGEYIEPASLQDGLEAALRLVDSY
ncbi:MAG: M20/M25/M40 family metallo-hydrolase [Clostridia bacterium]|nr:M20/M25/M40 family metallo-hydrolase [Clostridia bacterium]